MQTIDVKVENLTEEAFLPFGDLIGLNKRKPDYFTPEVSYWTGLSLAGDGNSAAEINWADIKQPRPFVCDTLEKHLYTTEAMIPMFGQSIGIFGLSLDMDDPDSPIDFTSFKAFILNNSCCVNVKIGVWHTQPWILSNIASFVVIIKKDAQKNDLKIVDLKAEYNSLLKLIL